MRPVTNHHGTIQHFVNGHCATRQRIPPACLADLEHPIIQHYRVVLVHVALVLNREHPIQILARGSDKRATHLLCGNRKPPVKLIHILRPQKQVGCFNGSNASQPQFLRQTALPSPVTALHPASRLRRIGRDHLNPQFF